SVNNFEIARKWLRECSFSHNNCRRRIQNVLPSRLIELSPLGQPQAARLRYTAGQKGNYAALSYCWGSAEPFRTTTKNAHAYTASLPYSKLPKTILDAFEVARNLDLRFIWIDSLCIVQDDDEDVKTELGRMVQVYRNARITISVASAFNCHEGFLDRSLSSQGVFHMPVPINKRAWTLQEHLLSPFLLIFTDYGMHWKCYSGSEPKFLTGTLGRDAHRFLFGLSPVEVLQEWQALLRNFTSRELSQESDRLPVVAAAAEVFSRRLGCDYLAGVWKDYLWNGLMWRVAPRKARPQKYQAPSWSWASVNGPITYAPGPRTFDALKMWTSYKANVVECSTIVGSSASKWGAVINGKLVM
ncbi:HET-domain-containing protein, partial [Mollisia scopiformis]